MNTGSGGAGLWPAGARLRIDIWAIHGRFWISLIVEAEEVNRLWWRDNEPLRNLLISLELYPDAFYPHGLAARMKTWFLTFPIC
jgi:hypothetical protein